MVTHILKAIGLTVNLFHLGTCYVHSVTRQIFCNILGINWQYRLKPCRMIYISCYHVKEQDLEGPEYVRQRESSYGRPKLTFFTCTRIPAVEISCVRSALKKQLLAIFLCLFVKIIPRASLLFWPIVIRM